MQWGISPTRQIAPSGFNRFVASVSDCRLKCLKVKRTSGLFPPKRVVSMSLVPDQLTDSKPISMLVSMHKVHASHAIQTTESYFEVLPEWGSVNELLNSCGA